MSPDEAGVEQAATGCGVGHRQWNTAEGALVLFDRFALGVVINVAVLRGFREIELLDVLTESGREVTHQEIGLLNGFFRVHEVVFHLRTNHSVGQARWCGVCTTRGASVRLCIVASKKMVQDMTGVGQEVGRKGRPVFGKQGRNGLE